MFRKLSTFYSIRFDKYYKSSSADCLYMLTSSKVCLRHSRLGMVSHAGYVTIWYTSTLPKVLKLYLMTANLNLPYPLSGSNYLSLKRKAISCPKLHQKDFPLTQSAGGIGEPLGYHRMQQFYFLKRSYADTQQKFHRHRIQIRLPRV